MIETHPFGDFIPKNIRYLIIGTFPARQAILHIPGYDWFFTNKVNQFWPIVSEVYKVPVIDREDKIRLFTKLHIGIVDMITECERVADNNSDTSLVVRKINKSLNLILINNKIEVVYFTSFFAQRLFIKYYGKESKKINNTELVRLPSPSPRNARMPVAEKVRIYGQLLPKLH